MGALLSLYLPLHQTGSIFDLRCHPFPSHCLQRYQVSLPSQYLLGVKTFQISCQAMGLMTTPEQADTFPDRGDLCGGDVLAKGYPSLTTSPQAIVGDTLSYSLVFSTGLEMGTPGSKSDSQSPLKCLLQNLSRLGLFCTLQQRVCTPLPWIFSSALPPLPLPCSL